MKLLFMRIINFKQFYGEQTVTFSAEKDLNVTIFHGLNGTGKTSLFTSINWCLYGTGDEGTGELLNKQAFEESKDGSTIPVVVTIGFRDKGIEYIAERVRYFTKRDNETNFVRNEFTLTQLDRLGNTKVIPNPEGKMDSILPKNVREYFFFDGEKMDDLTKPGNSKIEEAIKNIMRLPIIDKAEKHLLGITREYRSEIQRMGDDRVDQLINIQNKLEEEIDQLKTQNKNREQEIIKGNRQIEEIESLLADSREVGDLQVQRNSLNSQIQRLEQQRGNLAEAIFKLANLLFPIFLTNKAAATLTLINSKVGQGKIPSGIKEPFLQEILNKGICICGRPFEAHSHAYDTLNELLQQTQPNAFEDSVLKLRGEISTISRLTSERFSILSEKSKEYNEKGNEIEDLSRKVDELSRRIGNSQEIDISALESKRAAFVNSVKMLYQAVGQCEAKINQKQDQIVEIIREREVEEKKQQELVKLSMREKMARLSTEYMTSIRERFYEETRKQIESETKKVFDTLAWKTEQFNEIRLDQDFHLEVIDRWNKPSREEMGAGERQILSLSFIAAMVRLSGEEAPVIMDTPFARLSGNHLKNVANKLPDLVPQLVLFVTDQEWNDSSKAGLEPRVGAQYQLHFIDGCTTIEEVPFA